MIKMQHGAKYNVTGVSVRNKGTRKRRNKEGFKLYTRRRNLTDFIDDYSKKSSSDNCPKPRKY